MFILPVIETANFIHEISAWPRARKQLQLSLHMFGCSSFPVMFAFEVVWCGHSKMYLKYVGLYPIVCIWYTILRLLTENLKTEFILYSEWVLQGRENISSKQLKLGHLLLKENPKRVRKDEMPTSLVSSRHEANEIFHIFPRPICLITRVALFCWGNWLWNNALALLIINSWLIWVILCSFVPSFLSSFFPSLCLLFPEDIIEMQWEAFYRNSVADQLSNFLCNLPLFSF